MPQANASPQAARPAASAPVAEPAGEQAARFAPWIPIRSLSPRHRERIGEHLLALPERDRYLRFVQRINKPAYFKISQHKLVEKSLLQSLHLPTAALLGYFHPRKGQATDGAPLTTATELEALLGATAPAEWDRSQRTVAPWRWHRAVNPARSSRSLLR